MPKLKLDTQTFGGMKIKRASMIFNLAILILFAFYSSAVSSFAQMDKSKSSPHITTYQQAKTDCNCSLMASSTIDVFKTDAIAVSFVVSVKNSKNSTTDLEKDFSFVWVHRTRAMFLLALPDDSEILSLTTLQHSVRVLIMKIQMTPTNDSQCFKMLTFLCQAKVIVAAFYSNANFHVPYGKPFCFPPIEQKNISEEIGIVHRCCSLNGDTEYVNCTETIYPNVWVAYAIVSVQLWSAIMFVLSPLLFKYLPARDTQISKRSRSTAPRFDYSNMPTMSIDSTAPNRKLLTLLEPLSFVTCGGDEAQACCSRLTRALILLIFPIIICIYVVFFFVNNHAAKIRTNVSYYTGFVAFLEPPIEFYVFAVEVFCLILLGVLVLIPGHMSGIGKALSGRKDEKTFLSYEKPAQFINHHSGKVGFQFLHENMVFHLKCCFDLTFWLFILKVIISPCTHLVKSCCCVIYELVLHIVSPDPEIDNHNTPPTLCNILGFIFLPVLMVVWTAIVIVSLLVYVTPVGYVTFRIFRVLYNKDSPFQCECCEKLPSCVRFISVVILYLFFILFCVCVVCSYIFVTFMFGVFTYILCKIFLYTLIGFGFNVTFYIPYAVAGLFVLFYIWKAFNHYLSVYENLRIVLFEECEKYEQQASLNGQTDSPGNSDNLSSRSSGTGLLLLLDCNDNPSIPLNLFVATYQRLRPRGKTFFTILTKLMLTFLYLSIAFSSIMSLNKTEDTSTYVQAVFLFATFALPLLLFHGDFARSKRRRKELEYKVRFIIHRYLSKLAAHSEVNSGGSVDLPTISEIFEI